MRIFISYRRDDLAAHSIVGRIHERLSKRYGAANVFADEHTVAPGADFRDVIQQRLASCDVVFALIGPQWLDLMRQRDAASEDHLRFEIETALRSNIPIVPILLAGAVMPPASELSPEIDRFAYLNARSINPGPDFNYQLDRLLQDLDKSKPPRRRAALAIAGVLLTALAGLLAWFTIKPALQPTKQLSVLVVMGENVDYEKEIRDSFLDKLETGLGERNIKLVKRREIVPVFEKTYASPVSALGRKAWDDVISSIRTTYKSGEIDYFATLGSFASIAIKDSGLLYELGAKGLIFLGVTDPQRAGLVGHPKVAGVRYGTGGVDYGKKVAELFPDDQKLVFIYQSEEGNIQDKGIAADLDLLNDLFVKTKPAARQPRFEIRPLNKLIEIEDLAKADPAAPAQSEVYFAWYGLDNILSKQNLSALTDPNLWIIPSTYSVRNFRAAGLIVSVDDSMVGQFGAEIILKHVDDPRINLDQMPVRSPSFRVWINRPRVAAKGIKLLESALTRNAAGDRSYSYETSVSK